jgi:hypothetical protein
MRNYLVNWGSAIIAAIIGLMLYALLEPTLTALRLSVGDWLRERRERKQVAREMRRRAETYRRWSGEE